MEDNEEQLQNNIEEPSNKAPKQLQPFLYKKGMSGNPKGRPIGSVSMKTYVKNKLLSMTDDEREEFLEGLDKKTIWEMAEDKAGQGVNVTGEITSKVISVDE